MIVAIGERVHDPNLNFRKVERWRRLWLTNPVGCIRATPAMTRGNTRSRLVGLMSMKPGRSFRIVNLLPPDNRCGTWDSELAELCATNLLTWLHDGQGNRWDPWERIIMLGKRVSEELTDRRKVEFGATYDLCGVPALCFPHPSGRSRYLNEEDYREKARRWARDFLREL